MPAEFVAEELELVPELEAAPKAPFEFPLNALFALPPNAVFALPPSGEGCEKPPELFSPPELFNPPGEPIALAPGIELPPIPPARPPARVTPGSP